MRPSPARCAALVGAVVIGGVVLTSGMLLGPAVAGAAGRITSTPTHGANPLPTVTATSPVWTGVGCTAGGDPTPASYTVPVTRGVRYFVRDGTGDTTGTATRSGTYRVPAGTTVTVSVAAAHGFRLAGPTTFVHTFSRPGACRQALAPPAPTITDVRCTAAGPTTAGYTVPSTDGVQYHLDSPFGVVLASGPHHARPGTSIVVVAVAERGSALTGTTSWAHTFGTRHCATPARPVTVRPPRFVTTSCGRYRATFAVAVPRARGVRYLTSGQVLSPGRHPYPPGSTVLVSAVARHGYRLGADEQSRWRHTFRRSACHGHRPDGAGHPLASTGPPTRGLLVAGLLAVVVGVGCCFAGSRRPVPAAPATPPDHPGRPRELGVPAARLVPPRRQRAAAASARRQDPPGARSRRTVRRTDSGRDPPLRIE